MKREYIDHGFIEYPYHPLVEKIVCVYDGPCTVHYRNAPPKTVLVECSSYNHQYGYPISEDGQTMFVSSWEKGLSAYDIQTNDLLWRLKRSRITRTFVYPTYVVTTRYGVALLKFDVRSGEVLAELKSGTIDRAWGLQAPYILVESYRGKLAVVDTERMAVVKTYQKRSVNPNCCLSLIIQNVQAENNTLTISGLEECPNGDMWARGQTPFTRVLDTALYDGL